MRTERKKRSLRTNYEGEEDQMDVSPKKSPRNSKKSSPRNFSRKTPVSTRKPKVFGTSYSTSMTMLSQSLPASALATRFKAMPKPSDRIRSRYLDRLNIVKGSPLDVTSSTTAPIPTGNTRRSQEYLWHNAADDDEEDLLGEDNNTTGDFFQLDDLDMNTNDTFGDDEMFSLTPASTPAPSKSPTNCSASTTDERRTATTTTSKKSTKAISIPVPSSSRRGSLSKTSHRPIAQSFVPPHELIKQRRGFNHYERAKMLRRKAPARSPE